MGPLAGFSGRELCRVAETQGWRYFRTRGSHRVYNRDGAPINLSIPMHPELQEGLVRNLVKKMGLSVEEFLRIATK